MFESGNKKNVVDFNMIITLCGSIRFKEKFWEAAKELIKEGYLVLTPNFCNFADGANLTEKERKIFDAQHRKKIDVSDAIFVINCDGYIGEHTKTEIEYARILGKPVYYRYISCENDCYCVNNCVARKKLPCVIRINDGCGFMCPYYSPEDK